MRLSDVMSAMDLTFYPQVGLVIFLGVFAGVCVSLLARPGRFEKCGELPLDSDGLPEASKNHSRKREQS